MNSKIAELKLAIKELNELFHAAKAAENTFRKSAAKYNSQEWATALNMSEYLDRTVTEIHKQILDEALKDDPVEGENVK